MVNRMQFYIDGAWVDPVAPKSLDVIDPSTGTAFEQIALGSAADVDKAVAAAKRAFRTYGFTQPQERLELLLRIIEVYKKRSKDLAAALAGAAGVVALALSGYGLGILPVNWFGVVFLALALVLFVLDIKAPTHGALTVAGIGSFAVGALVLFNSPNVPQFQRVSVPLVVIVSVLLGVSFAVILGFALRAQKVPLRMGQQTLIGAEGTAKEKIDPHGQVQLKSELWSADLAEGAEPIQSGDKVSVVGIEGLRIKVRKA